MAERTRIGAVSYLNARPLVHGLEQGLGSERLDLSYHVPSDLADRMATGELEIGLLPVIELARMPELEVLPGLGIVTRGPSRSVLLVSRVPLDQIRTAALDPHSRTTNALTRVLFARRWKASPSFIDGDEQLRVALDGCDAAVRIGDKALFETLDEKLHVQDLAGVWTDWTGLPFVFAVWAARPGAVDREVYRMLHESRRRGSQALDSISSKFRWKGRSNPELALDYLTESIHFRLGSVEIDAMKRFFAAAADLGLIEEAPRVRLALQRWTTCHETAARLGEPTCRLR